MIKRYKTNFEKRMVRTRAKIKSGLPRLTVFKSNKYVYVQIIDDAKGITMAAVKDKDPKKVGGEIAALAKKAKITAVVFDRGGYRYHGQVRQLAEAAREGGLQF